MRIKWILLIVVAVAAAVFVGGCFSHNNLALLPTEDGSLNTKVVQRATTETSNRILIVDIDGLISEMGDDFLFYRREPTTFQLRQKLRRALSDSNIKAVILRIDSPGGGANASDICFQEVLRYKSRSKVPVVAMLMGVAASGGYYIAAGADKIVAHPNTVAGSIGAISFGFGFDGLFEKIGMESRVVKSGAMKDMGNPFDKWGPEEKAAIQKIIDEMGGRFVADVSEQRGLTEAEAAAISDGRVFTASEAKSLKLVDRIGYIDDAVDEALSLANIRDAEIIMYTTSDRADRNMYTQSSTEAQEIPTFSMGQISAEKLLELARPRMMYLWLGH
jgi:protease IV